MYRNSSRQFTSILLALIIAFMMMPAYTWADTGTAGAGSGTDPGSGQTRDVGSGGNADTPHTDHEDGQQFAAWGNGTNEDKFLPGPSYHGNSIYLTKDIVLESTWTVPYNHMKLCLNGYTIKLKADTGGPVINVASGTSLDLYDCKGGGSIYGGNRSICVLVGGNAFTMHSGKLTGGYAGNSYRGGGAVSLNAGASFNMKGGVISGNSAGSAGGGAIWADSGKIVINGGTISGNTSETSGGAVKTTGSSRFVMNGGTISGNFAAESGGGLFLGSTSELNAGIISGNEADSKNANSMGGGLYFGGGPIEIREDIQITGNRSTYGGGIYVGEKGTHNIRGSKIDSNTAANGGGIYIQGNLKVSEDSLITGNKASTAGGGIYHSSGNAVIEDSVIRGNTSTSNSYDGGIYINGDSFSLTDATVTGNGGGIFVKDEKKLIVSGKVVINNNTGNHNVMLDSDEVMSSYAIISTGRLSAGTSIGVYKYINESGPNIITEGFSANNSGKNPEAFFISDVSNHALYLNDGEVAFSPREHEHKWEVTPATALPGYKKYAGVSIRCVTEGETCPYHIEPASIELYVGNQTETGPYTKTYDGWAARATAEHSANCPADIVVSSFDYYRLDSSDDPNGTKMAPGHYPIDAGEYYVEATVEDRNNSGASQVIDQKITINKADIVPEVHGYTNRMNTGSPQELAYVSNDNLVDRAGTMYYRVFRTGEEPGSEWSTRPLAADSGSYTVQWYFKGDANHNDVHSQDNPGFVEASISEYHEHDGKKYIEFPSDGLPSGPPDTEGVDGYFLTEDITLRESWNIINSSVSGKDTLEICLNGKTINGNKKGLLIKSGGKLRIIGDKHEGGKLTGFEMGGGGIQIGSAQSGSAEATSGTLELQGVDIENCSGAGAGAITVIGGSTLKMKDGSIRNCNSTFGAVYVHQNANFEISGSPVITDNTNDSNKSCNVYLVNTGAKINVSGSLGEGTDIGVRTEDGNKPTPQGYVFTITNGYDPSINGNNPGRFFKSDFDDAKVFVGLNGNEAVLAYHEHNFVLRDDGSNSCKVVCTADGCQFGTNIPHTVRITASDGIYDTDPHGAELYRDDTITDLVLAGYLNVGQISYYYSDGVTSVTSEDLAYDITDGAHKPYKRGEYKAKVDVKLTHGSITDNRTLSTSYAIEEMDLPSAEVTLTPKDDLAYTGSEQELVEISGWEYANEFCYSFDKETWETCSSDGLQLNKVPSATAIGDYTIYYYVKGIENVSKDNGSRQNPKSVRASISHKHDWDLRAVGNKATVKCTGPDETDGSCRYTEQIKSDGFSVTLVMADSSIDGKPYTYEYGEGIHRAVPFREIGFPARTEGVTVDPVEYFMEGQETPLGGAPSAAGKYVAKAKISASKSDGLAIEEIKQNFEIIPAQSTATVTGKTGLKETDKMQDLVDVSGVKGGTVMYSLNGSEWKAGIPQASAEGKYSISWYVRAINGNYKDLGSTENPEGTIEVTIAPKDPDDDGSGGGDGGGGGGQDVDPDDGGKDGGKDTDPDDGGKDGGKDTDPDDGGDGDGTIDELVPVTLAKATAKGSNRIKVTWNNVKGAERYVVYLARCSGSKKEKTFKKVKTAKAPLRTWTTKKLKKNRYYKVRVIAQKKVDGKYQNISKSLIAHVYIGKGKLTNPRSIRLSKTKATIKAGKKYRVKGKVVKVNKKKKIRYKGHAAALRYVSSNKKVATVSKKGVIKAVSAGSCKVYVQGVNGVWKTFTVTVN